jgi:hypothetical protein
MLGRVKETGASFWGGATAAALAANAAFSRPQQTTCRETITGFTCNSF